MASTMKSAEGFRTVADTHAIAESLTTEDTKRLFFRSTLFQILIVGLCAFCAPGIWSAMNGLGVGGSQSPNLVNAANALLYAFMTVACFTGPWITNAIGFKWTFSLGSIGYPLYAAGLYLNNRPHGLSIWAPLHVVSVPGFSGVLKGLLLLVIRSNINVVVVLLRGSLFET